MNPTTLAGKCFTLARLVVRVFRFTGVASITAFVACRNGRQGIMDQLVFQAQAFDQFAFETVRRDSYRRYLWSQPG